MKKRLDVEKDIGRFIRGEISERDYLHPSTKIDDIQGESECRADIITRGKGDKGAHRVLGIILAYYGPTVYKEVAPQLGEGAEVFDIFRGFAKEMAEQNDSKTVTLFDFIKEFFDIKLPSKE